MWVSSIRRAEAKQNQQLDQSSTVPKYFVVDVVGAGVDKHDK